MTFQYNSCYPGEIDASLLAKPAEFFSRVSLSVLSLLSFIFGEFLRGELFVLFKTYWVLKQL